MIEVTVGAAPGPLWAEPLKLRVSHVTRYHYHAEVWDSFNEARLRPGDTSSQICEDFTLQISPVASVRDYPDFYSNCVHYFDVIAPHQELVVEAVSQLRTYPDTRGLAPVSNPYVDLKHLAMALADEYFDFMHDSEYVSLEGYVWKESMDVISGPVTDFWLDAVAIGKHIFHNFKYTPEFTTVNTRPEEVLVQRKGVCQDFAHVMLGMCRSRGIPARYVSGYFYNPDRAPDENEASHAWVEVYLPGYGWQGFDPTHDRVPDTRYVKLAVGRDYGDIKPLSGTFRGKGTREMLVNVKIDRLTD